MLKRIFTALSIISIFISGIAAAQKTGYEITVRVPGMNDTMCFLANYYGDKQYIKDTVFSDEDGVVVFSGNELLKGGVYIFVFPDKRYFEMVVDKEQVFSMETTWDDPINSMKVKGSKDNIAFYDYLKSAITYQKKNQPLMTQLSTATTKADSTVIYDQMRENEKQVSALRDQFIQNNPDALMSQVFAIMKDPEVPKEIPPLPDGTKDSTFQFRYYKSHFLDHVNFADHRLVRTPVFHPKFKKYMQDLTLQLPDSVIKEADYIIELARPDSEMFKYVLWWLTYTYETSKIMGMDEVFVHLVEKYYMTGQSWWTDSAAMAKIINRARKMAPNLIGNVAPEIALKDTLGNWQILSKVNAKFTILVFYDPDCGHCQKEMPVLKEAYDKWKDKGVEIYAVDIEVDEVKWKKFIREKKLTWINVNDAKHTSNFRQLYDVYSTPVIYILDQKKVIRAKRIAAGQVDELLERFWKMDFSD